MAERNINIKMSKKTNKQKNNNIVLNFFKVIIFFFIFLFLSLHTLSSSVLTFLPSHTHQHTCIHICKQSQNTISHWAMNRKQAEKKKLIPDRKDFCVSFFIIIHEIHIKEEICGQSHRKTDDKMSPFVLIQPFFLSFLTLSSVHSECLHWFQQLSEL